LSCPHCGKSQPTDIGADEPKNAVKISVTCLDCLDKVSIPVVAYYDKDGKEIPC
jgi:hypothetical protein